MPRMLRRSLLVATVGAAFVLALYQLGSAPLYDYDESTYAEVTHEMRISGDIFDQTFLHQPFFEKPPLYVWLASAAAEMFGETPFALRFPSALAYVGLCILTMLCAYALTEDVLAALYAGMILLTVAPLLEAARQVRLDSLAALSILLAFYGMVQGRRTERSYVLFGIGAGLTLLDKSALVFFPAAGALLYTLLWRDWHWLRSRWWWTGILGGLALVVPWHLYESLRYGARFWHTYLTESVGVRFSQNIFGGQSGNDDYVWYLANFAVPWTQVLLLSLVPLAVFGGSLERQWRLGIALSLGMVSLVLVVFFAAATKAPTYLLPLYPFAALVLALSFGGLRRTAHDPAARLWLHILLVFGLGLGAWMAWYSAFHHNPYYALQDELAREELAIAPSVAHRRWYVFGRYTNLGALMYYSQNLNPLALTAAETLRTGDVVLVPAAQRGAFMHEYPVDMTERYRGAQLELFAVAPKN